jgi:hypothetical protein
MKNRINIQQLKTNFDFSIYIADHTRPKRFNLG